MSNYSGIDSANTLDRASELLWAKNTDRQVLTTEKAQRTAAFFSVLGDANRWRILSALANREMPVGELAAAVEMSESAVSHQQRDYKMYLSVKLHNWLTIGS